MRHTAFLAAVLAMSSVGASADELRNWFNDPFFKVTSAVLECLEPAGPRATEAERQAQSHRRAEKGTTCWLANEEDCQRSNAFSYDQDIALEIKAAMQAEARFRNTSLWVTVQGRVVYVEGCVSEESQAAQLEALLKSLPHVQQAIAIVTARPKTRPPYKLFRSG